MTGYRRPVLEIPVFRDAAGSVIEYGNRWHGSSPPDDSYSVDSNPERFAPLHTVADALIEYLRATFDVVVSEDPAHADEFLLKPEQIVRTARLTPSVPDAAPLTFAFTSYPGVLVHAGLLQEFAYPPCGCDACDDSAENQADELEWTVLAVAAGGFQEHYLAGLAPRFGMSLVSADGQRTHSGDTHAMGVSKAMLKSAQKRLKALPDGWKPWPRR